MRCSVPRRIYVTKQLYNSILHITKSFSKYLNNLACFSRVKSSLITSMIFWRMEFKCWCLLGFGLRKRVYLNGKVEWSLKQVAQESSRLIYNEWNDPRTFLQTLQETIPFFSATKLDDINSQVATIPTTRLFTSIGQCKSFIGSMSINLDNGTELPLPSEMLQMTRLMGPVWSKVVDYIQSNHPESTFPSALLDDPFHEDDTTIRIQVNYLF